MLKMHPPLVIGHARHPHSYHFRRESNSPYWVLGYLNSGCILTETRQGKYKRSAKTVSLIPPHNAYSLSWGGGSEQWQETYTLFVPEARWESLLQWPVKDHGFGILTVAQTWRQRVIEEELDNGRKLLRSARSNRRELAGNALERVLLLLDEINPLRGRIELDSRISAVLEFLGEDYAGNHSVEILAEIACLSPSHFSHLFREQMQLTPMRYLERYRLERAAEKLLSSNMTISQIALNCGFSNSEHFSTRFKIHFGASPRNYRTGVKESISED